VSNTRTNFSFGLGACSVFAELIAIVPPTGMSQIHFHNSNLRGHIADE
jgi:hypothetical protein